MVRVVLTYKARVVWALGVKDGAVCKCVTRGALRTRRGAAWRVFAWRVPYILGWVFEEEEERPWFYGEFFDFL